MTFTELAILGWDERVERILPLLEAHAGCRLVGVADCSGVALVRARAVTGAPCFQHTAEMVRRLDYDALLIADAEAGADLASSAAARGADLFALGDVMPSAALEALATAAVRHGVALALLRPLLQGSGVAHVRALVAGNADARPDLLTIELQDRRPPEALLRDAVALATRLLEAAPERVSAAAAGPRAAGLAAQLRYAGGALATLLATTGLPAVRLRAHGAAETPAEGAAEIIQATEIIELDERDGAIELTRRTPHGAKTAQRLHDPDPLAREVARIAAVAGGDAEDLRLAHREAAVLGALESALLTSQTHHVIEPGVRATLHLLKGGTQSSAHAGRLRVVPAGRAS